MRREMMREDAKQRRVDRIIVDFWEAVWRAKPRIFRHRLPRVERLHIV
jgi:hypothetical protein